MRYFLSLKKYLDEQLFKEDKAIVQRFWRAVGKILNMPQEKLWCSLQHYGR